MILVSLLSVITTKEMVQALKNTECLRGMDEKEVFSIAEFVLNFFGYEDYALDNILTPKDRDIFYTLEEEGILKTVSEEVLIKKGQLWRIHYWKLNHITIGKLCEKKPKPVRQKNDDYAIYRRIDNNIWDRNER